MSRPQKPDPDEPVVPGSNHTPALAFAEIRRGIQTALELWKFLMGFTYSPKSGTVSDVDELYECLALFIELVRGNRDFRADRPVYLVAFTCNTSTKVDNVLKEGYEKVTRISNQPLIGYWKSAARAYLDAVAPLQFISKNAAIREGKKHGQEYILAIKPNGRYEHIKAN